jgi:hypothetical protein
VQSGRRTLTTMAQGELAKPHDYKKALISLGASC